MCGFTGYYLFNDVEKNSKTILDMLALQKHRGPDDSGIVGIDSTSSFFKELKVDKNYSFEPKTNLIFGFNRLSILDLSKAGHQPMIHKQSKVILMMNGEVYNAFDYKKELIKKGYTFKGDSDTEVVLYLYVEYGIQGMLDRLNGMFAISIYDGITKDLFLIRDRMGIKPLYIHKSNDRFSFSSELKSFKALPKFKFELNEKHLSEFLLFRNTINNTLFKDIYNLTPGTFLKISNDHSISQHIYYDVRKEGKSDRKINKEDLQKTLLDSVKRQMMSDVKLGCQLSGGVDSSLITAYSSEFLTKGSLETVSIVFKDRKFSEKDFIDEVSKKYNLISHQFSLDAKSYLDLLEDSVFHFEHPLNHPNTIGINLLSKEAKKYVTVLLSGEGADEIFAGYDRFLPLKRGQYLKYILKELKKNKSNLLRNFNDISNNDLLYILRTSFSSTSLAKNIYSKFSFKDAIDSRLKIWNSIDDDEILLKKRKYEVLSYLPDLLMRQDKMSMAHTIENRVPFLDNSVIEMSMQLNKSQLISKKNSKTHGKFILKELCADKFSDEFTYRNKMGFGIPLKEFYASKEFNSLWNEKILPNMKSRGLFNTNQISKWMEDINILTPEKLDVIWLMVNFEIWASQYLD